MSFADDVLEELEAKRRREQRELYATIFVVAVVSIVALVNLWAIFLREPPECTYTRHTTTEGFVVSEECG